jgi:hypothetical protein
VRRFVRRLRRAAREQQGQEDAGKPEHQPSSSFIA